jgi:exodeoxyribonuclease V gamma subunit
VLRVHRAERADVLVDALAEVLRVPLADPFQLEVVAVPAKGVERWLSQRLSSALGSGGGQGRSAGGDGVAAGLLFPSPARLVDEAVASASGLAADDDPWAPERAVWTLLQVVDDCVGEPWCGVLAAHLGAGGPEVHDGHRAGRRYAVAEHLGGLFRSYAAHRPAMLVDWAAGDDTDGTGAALDPDLCWQAELWRRLRGALGAPSPAERLSATCERLRGDPATSPLPARLSLFGATRLTTAQRALLAALSAHREVHLWLPHSSPAMWEALRDTPRPLRRADDESALRTRSPLLASLARDTRELQLLLGAVQDEHHPTPPPRRTLLGAVQAAVRDGLPPTPVARADGTVQVHSCHGPSRQVEVLREALLHLFADDPTLEPREVLVMCPDVETYAPLVRAAFGQPGAGHPGHRLRVRLADRSLRSTNPLLDVLSGLLALADGRVTASSVLDLAASGPVRRAFAFSDDDLERLRDWARRTGVRWGLGRRERSAHGLDDVPQNTWATGLDRLLLGVTADESELAWLGLALPLDDVDSSDVDLAGRLAELVERLDAVLGQLQGVRPARDWVRSLGEALDLLTEVHPDDMWQEAQARRELSEAAEHAGDVELRLPDVRALLAGRLAGRPTRAGFRTGELTVCTMVPMRSVPHRVLALLGLDDGVFPRSGSVDGDDVLQRDPCLGERDVRSEDRQLLLDAVMSAGDHLLLLYTGADPVTGATRPPAVPLGEVLDVLRATVGDDALTGVWQRHPLQPFDAHNFRGPRPSFHGAALAGARAALSERRPEPPLLAAALPPQAGDVSLEDLLAFLVHPVRAFLRARLGVSVPEREEAVADALPAELDGLQKWDVGERLLAARLSGVELSDVRQAEWRRGTLPPGPLGLRVLAELEGAVEPLVQAARAVAVGPTGVRDVDVDLGGSRRLQGTVGGLHVLPGGALLLASTSYSSLAAKHRLPAWGRLLALAAHLTATERTGGSAEVPLTAVTTGRGPYRRPVWRSTLTAPADAAALLRDLVALHDEGMRAPLPIGTAASSAYAARRELGGTVEESLEAAEKEWDSMFGDGKDRHLAYVLRPAASFAALTATADDGPERTRFGALARRLWAPLLAHESVGAP